MENGFAIIHANHLEDLTALTVDWLRHNPLPVLQPEIFLVQSNGMAQWLKLALAADDALGIAAAQQFQMPIRFLWETYRRVLGEAQVPLTSPFDKSRLHWRLMRLLPELLSLDVFAPLRRFLEDGDSLRKRYQLAERLADLYDQYQVYRADWLAHWEAGHDELPGTGGNTAMAEDERWQALLWRRLVEDMDPAQHHSARSHIHRRFIERLRSGDAIAGLPPRIVVFGISSLPQQVLEALYALAGHCQVLLLVQNPCRHYWADIVEDRHLLQARTSRHQPRPELASMDSDIQHRHANPLLASWGKQGRDYISLLYSYDDPGRYRDWFSEIDLFEDVSSRHRQPDSLLARIQQAILDLDPLPAPADRQALAPDKSVEFHIAHSRQREVEILHDQLLRRFQHSDSNDPLKPRDIQVMVPDIQAYAPHIEAVFGNVDRDDPRHIPFTISDRSQRHNLPLSVALEKLLDLPGWRFTVSELLDLLEVPALRQRFGITESDLPLLNQWVHDSGIRWGLSAAQRETLALPAGLEQNSWRFGLRRMLLGYCNGEAPAWAGVEPYDEIGGLEAALAGRLVALVDALEAQWQALSGQCTPSLWVMRMGEMMDALFEIESSEDLMLQSTFEDALQQWCDACDEAGFAEPLPLNVARESWLSALDNSSLSQRFMAGRVNFCTLMPMRSIPFRLVCLLGMNDGDYPRSPLPMDFDLMSRREHYRPGDRSRREDDRYLFLEALLSAREQLYVSWAGRSVRDNQEQPPSVLVAQLRDYIDAGWQPEQGKSLVAALTTEHPLQPFSRVYMPGPQPAEETRITYAREWQDALRNGISASQNSPLPPPVFDEPPVLSPLALARFLKNPVETFFTQRLGVRFNPSQAITEDSEPFDVDGLGQYQLISDLQTAASRVPADEREQAMTVVIDHWRGAGALPGGFHGNTLIEKYRETAEASLSRWQAVRDMWQPQDNLHEVQLNLGSNGQTLRVEHWLDDLHCHADGRTGRLVLLVGDIRKKPHSLLPDWSIHLCACASGLSLTTVLVSKGEITRLAPLSEEQALAHLQALSDAWFEALQLPLPVASRSALALVGARDAEAGLARARQTYEGDGYNGAGERSYSMALARAYPEFHLMLAGQAPGSGHFEHWATTLYAPLLAQRSDLKKGELP